MKHRILASLLAVVMVSTSITMPVGATEAWGGQNPTLK